MGIFSAYQCGLIALFMCCFALSISGLARVDSWSAQRRPNATQHNWNNAGHNNTLAGRFNRTLYAPQSGRNNLTAGQQYPAAGYKPAIQPAWNNSQRIPQAATFNTTRPANGWVQNNWTQQPNQMGGGRPFNQTVPANSYRPTSNTTYGVNSNSGWQNSPAGSYQQPNVAPQYPNLAPQYPNVTPQYPNVAPQYPNVAPQYPTNPATNYGTVPLAPLGGNNQGGQAHLSYSNGQPITSQQKPASTNPYANLFN